MKIQTSSKLSVHSCVYSSELFAKSCLNLCISVCREQLSKSLVTVEQALCVRSSSVDGCDSVSLSDHEGLGWFVVPELWRTERHSTVNHFTSLISNLSTAFNGNPNSCKQNKPQHDNNPFDHSRSGLEEEEVEEGCRTWR